MSAHPWKIWIDTGGTFTDCLAIDPAGQRRRAKVLSSSALRGDLEADLGDGAYRIQQRWQAPDDFVSGFRFRLLNRSHPDVAVEAFDAERSVLTLDRSLPVDQPTGLSFELVSDEEAPTLAARLVTSTPVEAPLPPMTLRLATTKGTNALLEQKGAPTAFFVTKGFADLLTIGTQQRSELFALEVVRPAPLYAEVVEVDERLDAAGNVLHAIDEEALEAQVEALRARGIRSAAIALMHSYQNPAHERAVARLLRAHGFDTVSCSSALSRLIKILPRAETALVNAYLQPSIEDYLASVRGSMRDGKLLVMTSAGGLASPHEYHPKDSLLSGPAAGVVGAATIGGEAGIERVISFDMGGTSTDVARYDGDYDYVFEHTVGNAHLVAPALAIETVAAGGGSICSFDGHSLAVGPESAGASPGPACYGAGGPLTITDVNLLLGRLDPENFSIPVALEDAHAAFRPVVKAVREATGAETSERSILEGFLDIANERMADAIRKISLRKGYDPTAYALVSYGGAGGQHACAIARRLGIETVLIPADAGLLSAYGLGNAVMEQFAERQLLEPLDAVEAALPGHVHALAEEASSRLVAHGAAAGDVEVRRRLVYMRLRGQEAALEVAYDGDGSLTSRFRQVYEQHYGHWIAGRAIEVESVRVIASTKEVVSDEERAGQAGDAGAQPFKHASVSVGGREQQTPVYRREDLPVGACIAGPALILDPHSTTVLESGWQGVVRPNGTLQLARAEDDSETASDERPEAVQLELFINRFSAIAEEMGEMFQRTALSVNVKERLDFSCALLNAEGELVVNAPHIPVHLGALGLCVRRLIESIEMAPGDVVVTNHPAFGGAHLPDVTVVTPVFTDEGMLLGYAASRAHHAEIGGTRPGSMPPAATRLVEEGVVIPPMYLIRCGAPRWDSMREHLCTAPHPTRNVEENLTDLQAAVAANHRGAEALRTLARTHGVAEMEHYMGALKDHAAAKMCATLRTLPNGSYESTERLDDGTVLQATIQVEDEHLTIDFGGTSDVHPGNLNATPAIVNSVVMYVLRLLIDEPLPLNEGILDPVTLHLPRCLLNPDFPEDPARCPAVVGGNVETSQRLVDTLLKPFERVACSQGTMNNVLFGNDAFGYYETVCGGTGAGPTFDGADAVHHHMTNTRGTDPEILEHRYPVRLERYAIRPDSGGGGMHRGGHGVERAMTFLAPVRLSVLTQHRVERPYGLQGGASGQPGAQCVVYRDGTEDPLAPVDGRDLEAGDRFILRTPGGGGFGAPE